MIAPFFRISTGPCLVAEPEQRRTIPSLPADALAFAERIDREADQLLAEGQIRRAESLAHLALEARCRATGARA